MRTDKKIKNDEKRQRQRMAAFDRKSKKKFALKDKITELIKLKSIYESKFDAVKWDNINSEIDKCKRELKNLK
jgi:hypothetical protein